MTEATAQRSIHREIGTAVRHTFVYGVGSVLGKVVSFLMLPFYTHYLTPSDYGTLEILDLSLSLLGMFLNLGIMAAVLRYYAAANSTSEKKSVVSTALLCVGVTGFVCFLLGLSMIRPVSALLLGPKVPATYLLISFASFILLYVTNVPRTYLIALDASGTIVLIENIALFLLLGLNIYFIAVLKLGLRGILWSSFIVAALQAFSLVPWVIRQVGIRFSAPHFWQMARFGLPLVFSNLSMFVLNFSDRFFLQHLGSLAMVGIYAVGYKFGFMLNYLFVQSFFMMWQSRMYVLHSHPDHRQIFSRIFVLYSLLLTYMALVLALLSPEIVHLMVNPKFSASQNIIPVVALAYVFYGIGRYLQLGMFLTNKTSQVGIVSAIATVLNLLLNYVLVLHYGMMGAAWATALSFAALAIGSYYRSQRLFPVNLGEARVALAMGLAIGLYLLCLWCNPQSAAIALLIKACILAIFPVLLWKIGIISPAEALTVTAARNYTLDGVSRWYRVLAGRPVSS
jgi:O-antigen/teichoic acid export membrane protein